MLPKESGVNQSQTACCLCVRKSCRFSRIVFITETQFAIPKSSYVTTKLNGMSTCGCNNNAICSDKAIFTFPTVELCFFLLKYCVKDYDYIVKWCSGISCNWCVSLDIAYMLALTTLHINAIIISSH